MKKVLPVFGASLIILFICAVAGVWIWIDKDVKKNIGIAKEKYHGTAEDVLIAYLLDTGNSPHDRSNIAVWTLGQINSKKAIPVLTELYKDDPEGKTCYGQHDTVLCQYELYKALKATKSNWWPLHRRLNK